MEIRFPFYVVTTTTADGENYYPSRDFTSDVLAEAFYDSTVDRLNREDAPNTEVTVRLIETSVAYERTFTKGE